MFRQDDNRPEAKSWRRQQMLANSEISGLVIDRELVALTERWEQEEGLSQTQIAERLVAMLNERDPR